MSKEKKGIPITIGIASVWFGAHCGPGTASGRQTATYYNEFGKIGLFTPVLAMALLGICIYFAIEYARLTKTYNFKEWANKFFSPYDKVFANIFEFTYIFTVLMVLGSCIATGATGLNQYFGLPMIIGIFIIAGATLILAIFGAALVRASSSIMTFMILIALGIIIVTALASTKGNFAGNYASMNFATPSLFAAIWSALIYAGFQASGNIANAVSVAEGLNNRQESVKAAIYGVVLNTALIIGIALIIYAYPEAIAKPLPNYHIAEVLGQPMLLALYLIVLLLAVLTTTVGFAFAVAARYAPLIKGMKNGVKKDALITTVMLILCIGVSTFGLDKIVRVGFSYLGLVCLILVVIPVLLIGFTKVSKLRKEVENS